MSSSPGCCRCQDSFLLTGKRAEDALRFAHDVQIELLNADWAPEVDQLYARLINEGILYADCVDPTVKDLRLDKTLFSGVCVRIGMHWTTADIKIDHEQQLYDVFGLGIAAAARIEACAQGGMVLASEHFMGAVKDVALLDNLFVRRSLGKQSLRGIDQPIELVELNPAGLARRRFPPLRLERANDATDAHFEELQNASASGTGTQDMSVSKNTQQSATAGNETVDSDAAVHQAEFRFAHTLAAHSRRDPDSVLLTYDTLRCALAAITKGSKRDDIIAELLRSWRIDDSQMSLAHAAARKELGAQRYQVLRLSDRVNAVRQQQEENLMAHRGIRSLSIDGDAFAGSGNSGAAARRRSSGQRAGDYRPLGGSRSSDGSQEVAPVLALIGRAGRGSANTSGTLQGGAPAIQEGGGNSRTSTPEQPTFILLHPPPPQEQLHNPTHQPHTPVGE
jgi:hypothetical protein